MHLGSFAVLVAAGLTVAGLLALARLRPRLLLGPHGAWALRQGEEFIRRGARQLRRLRASKTENFAKANSK
jgi:hypothetical protein